MFNEILTGKATLEPPVVVDPYREGTTPEVTLTCTDCQESFRTKVGSGATRCGVCRVKVMEAQRAENELAIAHATYSLQQSQSNAKVIRYVVIAVIGFGLAFMKYQMRESLHEDMSVGQSKVYGYTAYDDPFAAKVHDYATDMCFCSDYACARGVLGAFDHWRRTAAVPTDEAVLDQVSQETDRFRACYTKLLDNTK